MNYRALNRYVLLLALGLLLPVPLSLAAAADGPRTFAVEVSGEGPPMVLIPGLASTGAVWDETVAYYRDRYTCHVVTLAGFGDTAPVEADPFLEAVRDELAAYIRDEGLGRPVVVGHSLGGFLGLWLAAEAPERVGALVVVDALPFLPAAQLPTATVEMIRPQAEGMRQQMAAQSPERFAEVQEAILATMITDSADVARAHAMAAPSHPPTVAQAFYELYTTDLRPLLPSIAAPTLVIGTWAGYHPYATREQVQQTFDAQYAAAAGARVLLADTARHFVMYDDLEGMTREMDAFLGGM